LSSGNPFSKEDDQMATRFRIERLEERIAPSKMNFQAGSGQGHSHRHEDNGRQRPASSVRQRPASSVRGLSDHR